MRVVPQFIEGERAILGGLIIDNEALAKVVGILRPEELYREAHRMVYGAMIGLFEANKPVDWVTLTTALQERGLLDQVGGVAYLTELADAVPSAANVLHYVEVVKEKAILRAAILAATEIMDDAYAQEQPIADFLDRAEQRMFTLNETMVRPSAQPLGRLLSPALANIEELYQRQEYITGVPSGFHDLDKLTAGFQPSDLVIVAGRPSMGKTSLALNVAEHAATAAGIPTLVYSLEMAKEQVTLRLLCSRARVNLKDLRSGFLAESDWPKLGAAAGVLSEAPIYIDDTPQLSPLEIRAGARRLKREHGIGLVIVDYLQLMRGSGRNEGNRENEISEISRSLKALAKELNVPVIALSQLNRKVEERADKRPQLADLRESGAIEQDADVIIFIYRDEVYNKSEDNPRRGEAEIIVGKQRNGPIGTVKCAFRAAWSSFLPLSQRPEEF